MGGGKQNEVFPIGVVGRLTGLSERQIRYYHDKGLIHPRRTPGNRRLFSPADVKRLKHIKKMLERGLNIKQIMSSFEKKPSPR